MSVILPIKVQKMLRLDLLRNEPARVSRRRKRPSASRKRGPKVLIIDPDLSHQVGARKFRNDFDVEVVRTPNDARRINMLKTFDVVVERLGKNSNFSDLLKEAEGSIRHDPLPRIVLTALDRDDLRVMALEASPSVAAIFPENTKTETVEEAIKAVASGHPEQAGLMALEGQTVAV